MVSLLYHLPHRHTSLLPDSVIPSRRTLTLPRLSHSFPTHSHPSPIYYDPSLHLDSVLSTGYVPLWLLVMCFRSCSCRAVLYEQCRQECGFSPVWTVMCHFRFLLWSDSYVHNLHLYITPSNSIWELRHLVVPIGSLQRGHGWLSSSSTGLRPPSNVSDQQNAPPA